MGDQTRFVGMRMQLPERVHERRVKDSSCDEGKYRDAEAMQNCGIISL